MSKIDDVVHKIFNDIASLTRSDAKRLILNAVGPNHVAVLQKATGEDGHKINQVATMFGAILDHAWNAGKISMEAKINAEKDYDFLCELGDELRGALEESLTQEVTQHSVASELFTALESVLDGLGAISNHSELSGWVSPEKQEQILGAYRMAKSFSEARPAVSLRVLGALQRPFRGPLNPMDPDPYLSPLQEKVQELLEDAGIDSEIYDAVAKLVEEGERVKASGSV